MAILVHHTPANRAATWSMRAWQPAWDGNKTQDGPGVVNGTMVNFALPEVGDPRTLLFRFHWTVAAAESSGGWESETLIRRLYLAPAEVWTFEGSPRVLYKEPYPAGVAFAAGTVLTFHVITHSAYRGGRIYVWNPYDGSGQTAFFDESGRDDGAGVSTFRVTLQPWMTQGFNLKLMRVAAGGDLWEPDTANRVWRPCDGSELWLKSGQCDMRSEALTLTDVPVEVLYSARMAEPPGFQVEDVAEGTAFAVAVAGSRVYEGSSLFRVATYTASIYPQAGYLLASVNGVENPAIARPFPADPTLVGAAGAVSRCALGASAWVGGFPVVRQLPIAITPMARSSFGDGVSVQLSVGNGPSYETVAAAKQADGSWEVMADLATDTTTAIALTPTTGTEPVPYAWINTARYFTPAVGDARFFTTEGVYGICAGAGTRFGEPANRSALMAAAFGEKVVGAKVFADREMPQGAVMADGQTVFVVHAPHAVRAELVLVDEAARGPVRRQVPMTLTGDTFYWWCAVSAADAPAGKRYRFLLNGNLEVLDPAARAVQDGKSFTVSLDDDPGNANTSWSVVLDANATYATAHQQAWQTMGWEKLLIYEMHVRRFTNLQAGALGWFDLLIDELKPVSRLGKAGYLGALPVTAFGLMPVSEFSGAVSWGYDPAYYFAIDSFYGGAQAMARFVNAAHAAGRAVTLDVVYNHSLNSSLMQIAVDVYRNGDYDGDRMNCGHPMALEYFRQASVYLFRTFNLDGFRFDDTNTIITKCQGGWEFLGAIRGALRAAADAEGRKWPYCVAENDGTAPFDVSNPAYGVMDGQWGISEVYGIKSGSYDTRNNSDSAQTVKGVMDAPSYMGRPFHQAVRFGESHDMVSAQDTTNLRMAARPFYGQGLQMAKALGTVTLLSNGVPMLFMGQEVGETTAFSFDDNELWLNPQNYDVSPGTDNTRVLEWFRQLMGLRNDASKGLQGDANYQVVATGNRTVAFTCGSGQSLFAVATFGTANQQQNSAWLGLPAGGAYKEIFNSSWPVFQVEFEREAANSGYDAAITSGQILNLPFIGAVVLERR